jgi:hypothetical protein
MALKLTTLNLQHPKKPKVPSKLDKEELTAKSKQVKIARKQLKKSGGSIKKSATSDKHINGK